MEIITEGSESVEIHDASWITSMHERLKTTFCHESPSNTRSPTIFRVPESMRCVDVDAYEPKIISIGPYHRGKEHLEAMEQHKWRYLSDFLTACPDLPVENCLTELKALENQARSFYLETVDLTSDDFVEMMLLDGCFLVEFLIKLKESSLEFIYPSTEVKEPIFSTMWILPPLVHDMLLLENQIPFLVPQCLLDLAMRTDHERYISHSLVDLHFFMFNCLVPLNTEIPPTPAHSVHHLLHLFHTHLLPSPHYLDFTLNNYIDHTEKNPLRHFSTHLHNLFNARLLIDSAKVKQTPSRSVVSNERKAKSIPTVTELLNAGVSFQKKEKKGGSIMEIEFKNGIMKIPDLYIYPNTISFFRNLIAFEQCYPNSKTHFTAYALFMDKFVNTPKDVKMLKEQGIIRHGLGTDEELTILFNQFGKGVNFYYSKTYLSNVYKEVKRYYGSTWHKWRAILMRDYFGSPWAFLSFLGALLLLLLNIIQAFYSILP